MHVDRVELLRGLDRGDGQCRYLEGRLCTIYDERPDICNVDKMYDRFFRDLMSNKEYYQRNLEGCRDIRKQHETEFLGGDKRNEKKG